MDLAGQAELGKVFYAAFPDITQTIDDAFADEEKVAVRFTIAGTHQGELMGVPPAENIYRSLRWRRCILSTVG